MKEGGIVTRIYDNKLEKGKYSAPEEHEYVQKMLEIIELELNKRFSMAENIGELFSVFFKEYREIVKKNEKYNGLKCFNLLPNIEPVLFLKKYIDKQINIDFLNQITQYISLDDIIYFVEENENSMPEFEKEYPDFYGSCRDAGIFSIGASFNPDISQVVIKASSLIKEINKLFIFHYERLIQKKKVLDCLYKKNCGFDNNHTFFEDTEKMLENNVPFNIARINTGELNLINKYGIEESNKILTSLFDTIQKNLELNNISNNNLSCYLIDGGDIIIINTNNNINFENISILLGVNIQTILKDKFGIDSDISVKRNRINSSNQDKKVSSLLDSLNRNLEFKKK